jgi:pimeloyl-ACP methyl ester carboxylesterase
MSFREASPPPSTAAEAAVSVAAFQADLAYLESQWKRVAVGKVDLPIIDTGQGEPLVFVPILEHLEFVYARQLQAFSHSRRVILYRRQEARRRPMDLGARVEELRRVLDALEIATADLLAHGDAAMVLFEFALRYPQRCRSLIIIAQGASYRIRPHPLIWLLHELYLRLPVERLIPAWLLRRSVLHYITASRPPRPTDAAAPLSLPPARRYLPRDLIEEQFCKIALWPAVYRFSVLPVIHGFDIRKRLGHLRMPVLLINRADDLLSPEPETRLLAERLPVCAAYHVISGKERFFMYTEAETVNQQIEAFLSSPRLSRETSERIS